MKRPSLEMLSVLYLAAYTPYIVLTRWLATTPSAAMGRSLAGLEILPATLIISGVMTIGFVWAAGWWRSAHTTTLGRLRLPTPTGWTMLSGVCTALVLFTVPLSFTFKGVSIPFIQVLMRADVLIVAPLVDLAAGRGVRWYSWLALALAAVGISFSLHARGGLYLPQLAIVTVVLYTVGYFGRLFVMTHVAKTGDPEELRGYFVEEKIVAYPAALVILALITVLGAGGQTRQLAFGFIGIWSNDQLGWLVALSALLFVISVFSAVILLDKRENTFCVPLERSASLLAGVTGAYWLALQFRQPFPTTAELVGAALLVAAIVVLSLGPRVAPVVVAEARAEA